MRLWCFYRGVCICGVSTGVYAFVVLKQGVEVQEALLALRITEIVSRSIAKYACPDFIQVQYLLFPSELFKTQLCLRVSLVTTWDMHEHVCRVIYCIVFIFCGLSESLRLYLEVIIHLFVNQTIDREKNLPCS